MTDTLQQITDTLLLNGTLVECPGLIHGKMGIAVFFSHYARHTNNQLFEDYALELIEGIQEQIHGASPTDYERGIAGIGVGMDYLIRNNFLDVDDDFFDDFDRRMYRAVMYDPWPDLSLYDGLAGYGSYWICRMNDSKNDKYAQDVLKYILKLIEEKIWDVAERYPSDIFSFLYALDKKKQFTDNVKKIMFRNRSMDHSFPRLDHSAIGNQIRTYLHRKYETCNNYQDEQQSRDVVDIKNRMGLLNGYAGFGLCLLGQVDDSVNSWMDLM